MQCVVNFGADPTGATDSTAEFNMALALGQHITVPEGNFKVSGRVLLPANSSLSGAGQASTTITTTAANFDLFTIQGSNVTVENLTVQNGAKTGGADFVLDTTANDIIQVRVQNIVTYSSFGFWADTGTSTNAYYLVWLTNCVARVCRGTGFSFTRCCAFLYVDNCTADYVGSAASNYAGFAVNTSVLAGRGAVGGAFFRQCAVNGTAGSGSNPEQAGYSFANYTDIWMTDCSADTCDGYGYSFNVVNHIHMKGCEASQCNNSGMVFDGCGWGEFTGCKVDGRQGLSGAATAINAVELLAGNKLLIFTGSQLMYATGDGFNIATQAGAINITGGIVSDCNGYGVHTSGTTAVLAVGLTLVANTAGNYNMAGAYHYLHSTMLSSGSVITTGPGPISG